MAATAIPNSGPYQRDRVQVNSDTFIYSGLGLSSKTDSTGTTYYSRCSSGLLNHETLPNGKKYYYLFDGLMSVVGLTGPISGGSISKANLYDYDPYGVMLNQSEYAPNSWKYAGGYFDTTTSLYKFGVRYYNPALGRWTQQDPVGGSLGDLNSIDRYVYAGDDPVNSVDPSGKSCIGDVLINIIVSGIATAIGIGSAIFSLTSFLSTVPEGLAAAAAAPEITTVVLGSLLACPSNGVCFLRRAELSFLRFVEWVCILLVPTSTSQALSERLVF